MHIQILMPHSKNRDGHIILDTYHLYFYMFKGQITISSSSVPSKASA